MPAGELPPAPLWEFGLDGLGLNRLGRELGALRLVVAGEPARSASANPPPVVVDRRAHLGFQALV